MFDQVKEWRIFGPPGTGKTTELSKRIRSTCQKFGSGSVMVVSFTKTAAIELAGRDLPLERDRVGTLHSFAYRAVGSPEIAETPKYVDKWNTWVGANPIFHLEVTREKQNLDDPYFQDPIRDVRDLKQGDRLLAEYSRLRTRMDPVPPHGDVDQFSKKWEAWKRETGVMDFTDLIANAYHGSDYPPVDAHILYADEVQDFSPLELALVRKWGSTMEYIVLAADDDQSIFQFRGAIPDAFLKPDIPQERKIFLPKSYRVPQRIKDRADRWIRRVQFRQDKQWTARPNDSGVVEMSTANWKDPMSVVAIVRRELARSEDYTVMVQVSCGYMLEPILRELRTAGIPFHNPYRVSNAKWNPVSALAKRVLAYLCNDRRVFDNPVSHTWGSVWKWLEHVDSKRAQLKHGAKKLAKAFASDKERTGEYLTFEDFTDKLGIEPPPRGDISWLRQRLLVKKARSGYPYLFQICREQGARYLTRRPRTSVGSIHSFKGGESDTAILFPDLSAAGMIDWEGEVEQRDAVRRMFYVGMTRARHRLILCRESDMERFVNWSS